MNDPIEVLRITMEVRGAGHEAGFGVCLHEGDDVEVLRRRARALSRAVLIEALRALGWPPELVNEEVA